MKLDKMTEQTKDINMGKYKSHNKKVNKTNHSN